MMHYVWLAMASAFTGLSLLTVIEAPGTTGWELAILATQFGHWLGPLALVCAVAAWFASRPRRGNTRGIVRLVSIVMFLGAAALLLLPAAKAWSLSRRAPGEMSAALGTARAASPFVRLGELFSIASRAPVATDSFVYAHIDGTDLALEVFHPVRADDAAAGPGVMLVHGGGWNRGTRNELSEFSHWLARSGYAVISIDYRLAPKWKWPAPREDVHAALAWLRENTTRLRVDPNRLVILGRSAGAQIAFDAAYEPASPFRGVISLYGPADLAFAYTTGRDDDALHSLTLLRNYVGGTPTDCPQNYADASPFLRATHAVPPTLLVHGQLDTLVWRRQSERLAERLTAAKARVYYLAVPAATHALEYNLNGPGGQLARGAVLQFLDATIGR